MADLPPMSSTADPAPVSRRDRARAERVHSHSRLAVWTVAIAVLVAAVDQLTKYAAQQNLTLGAAPIKVIGDFITFRLIYNPGAAMSIATGMTWVLTIVVLTVVVVIVRVVRRIRSVPWAIALGLLLGGAVGNLIDRLTRAPGFARGHVVDFIGYADFFVGNVADIAIVAAAVMIAWLAIRGIALDGTRHGAGGSREPAADTGDGNEIASEVAEPGAEPDAGSETPTGPLGRTAGAVDEASPDPSPVNADAAAELTEPPADTRATRRSRRRDRQDR